MAVVAESIAVRELPDHVTEATATVDASPAEVYAAVTDYASWPNLFSDVRSASVEAGGRRDGRIRFSSVAFDREVTVLFDNEPDHVIRFRGVEGPPGGRAHGSFVLTPVDDGRRTRVTAQLYMDVVGLPSLFVRESTITSIRQAKLRADLRDVVTRFTRYV
jgi:uncharacterized protein YndB with AHSA1/START domain